MPCGTRIALILALFCFNPRRRVMPCGLRLMGTKYITVSTRTGASCLAAVKRRGGRRRRVSTRTGASCLAARSPRAADCSVSTRTGASCLAAWDKIQNFINRFNPHRRVMPCGTLEAEKLAAFLFQPAPARHALRHGAAWTAALQFQPAPARHALRQNSKKGSP